MNRIITTSVSDPSIGQPFTAKSLDFIQDANKEIYRGLAQALIGDSFNSQYPYVLKGLVPYGTNQYTEGWVLWDGEIYYCAGKLNTTAFVNIPVMNIVVTNSGTADPVTFTDSISRNVHNVRRLNLVDALPGSGTFDLSVARYVHKVYVATQLTDNTGELNINSGVSWTDLTTMTYTTPNDGFTRKYQINAKMSVLGSNGVNQNTMYYRIQDTTNTTTLDYTTYEQIKNTVTDRVQQTIFLSSIVTLAPNTTVKVQRQWSTGSISTTYINMQIIELRE